jgi:hypothetical protein
MSEEWVSAIESFTLVATSTHAYSAAHAICSRAYDGLIDAKAARFIRHDKTFDDAEIPKQFWWAKGHAALKQNWKTGDFETWIDSRYHWRAYGVSFSRRGIEALIGPALAGRRVLPDSTAKAGGRPAAAWWDDLWIEICRQLYAGDLQPKKQADVESAMMDWASKQGHDPAPSTIRSRTRKLWTALNLKGRN